MKGGDEITTGTTRKMSQQYFCPAEYITKTKPKTNQKANPNPKPKVVSVMGYRFWLSVYTLLGKNIVGSRFWLEFIRLGIYKHCNCNANVPTII